MGTNAYVILRPSSLDASVYGLLVTILEAPMKKSKLKEIVCKYNNLLEFVKKIKENFFHGKNPTQVEIQDFAAKYTYQLANTFVV